MTKTEHQHRLAYAERQWDHFRLRAIQAQHESQLALETGDRKAAEGKLQVARNYIQYMDECNSTIDKHRRALEPGDGEEAER